MLDQWYICRIIVSDLLAALGVTDSVPWMDDVTFGTFLGTLIGVSFVILHHGTQNFHGSGPSPETKVE